MPQRKELWVELGLQQLTIARGGADAAVDPKSTHLAASGGGAAAAAVSQQGLTLPMERASLWRTTGLKCKGR